MRLIGYISFVLLITVMGSAYGQSWTGQAYEFYNADDLENAKSAIDSAIVSNERFDSQTWQLRGIIYRKISSGDQLYYREIALESFVRARKIDSTGIYASKIKKYIEVTIVRYYNDAVTLLLDYKEFEKSEESYNLYKDKYKTLLDPSHDFSQSDIDYYNAVGSQYLAKVELVEPANKTALREKAIFYCAKVLAIDSNDYKANYNTGIVYYNIAVDYVVTTEIITIEELILNQKKSEDAFLLALPYLHKAEAMRPNSVEVQEALMGCYYGLNRDKLYLKYQTLVDRYNLPNYKERFLTHPTDKDNIKKLIRIYSKTLIDKEEEERFRKILNDL